MGDPESIIDYDVQPLCPEASADSANGVKEIPSFHTTQLCSPGEEA